MLDEPAPSLDLEENIAGRREARDEREGPWMLVPTRLPSQSPRCAQRLVGTPPCPPSVEYVRKYPFR